MNALQKYELEEAQEMTAETIERFKIENLEQLNWALRKLAALESKQTDIDTLVAKEMERITAWREKEVAEIENSKAFFQGLIGEFALKQREADPKLKKMKTPYGQVSFKKQQPKWHYDEQKLVSYLNDNLFYGFIRVKEEPDKVAIKEHFKVNNDGKVYDMNGQEVEGIKVEFQADKLEIKAEV